MAKYGTDEWRENISDGNRRKWQDADYRSRNINSHRGVTLTGEAASGSFISSQGYLMLTMQYDHPLADKAGGLAVHRKVLYEKIGPGPHECHWNWFSKCGNTSLQWGGVDGINSDHLDGDKRNNDPDNLVPSCVYCNWRGIRMVVARGGIYSNNTSGVTGVSWDKRTQRWKARASGGRWLGRYDSLEDAAMAVAKAEVVSVDG